jgi:hypothetical protein
MSAQLWATGPVNVFACTIAVAGGSIAASNPLFLGCGREGPTIREIEHWERRMSDIGGTQVEDDASFQRYEHIINVPFERLDKSVAVRMRDYSGLFFPGSRGFGFPGVLDAAAVGSLQRRQNAGFGLILQFPNFALSAYSANGGVGGYLFYSVRLEGPQEFMTGTRDNVDNLTFKAIGTLLPDGIGPVGYGWYSYTNNLAGLTLVPLYS